MHVSCQCRYDAYNVWRNYQVGDAMPDISADMYNKVNHLVDLQQLMLSGHHLNYPGVNGRSG